MICHRRWIFMLTWTKQIVCLKNFRIPQVNSFLVVFDLKDWNFSKFQKHFELINTIKLNFIASNVYGNYINDDFCGST